MLMIPEQHLERFVSQKSWQDCRSNLYSPIPFIRNLLQQSSPIACRLQQTGFLISRSSGVRLHTVCSRYDISFPRATGIAAFNSKFAGKRLTEQERFS